MNYTFKNVRKINIELNNVCNLSCTLCQRSYPEMEPYLKNKTHLDFETLCKTIKKFPNIDEIFLYGNLSEPTLYYKFLDFIKFIKECGITITLSTNGNGKSKSFWADFGKLLTEKDNIIFAIDGSTQEKYLKYRINGNFDKVILNYKTFAENTKANKLIQIIKFPWLEEDIEIEFNNLRNKINPDNIQIYNFNKKIKYNHTTEEVKTKEDEKLNLFYEKLISFNSKRNKPVIDCFSKVDRNIFINYLGDIVPCCYTQEDLLTTRENHLPKIPNIYNLDEICFNDFFEDWYDNNIYKNESCIETCSSQLKFFRR
jgi:MoaA/NifB/PqqE/SkfB family radical SAM enzyme